MNQRCTAPLIRVCACFCEWGTDRREKIRREFCSRKYLTHRSQLWEIKGLAESLFIVTSAAQEKIKDEYEKKTGK